MSFVRRSDELVRKMVGWTPCKIVGPSISREVVLATTPGDRPTHDPKPARADCREREQIPAEKNLPKLDDFHHPRWNVGWVERRQLLGFATKFYQTNRYGARNGWEASETQHETRSTQPTHCRSPKSVITRKTEVHRGFVGSGKGNQSFQLWSRIANMPPLGSQGMPDQDGLVTIDTPFPTNPR